MFAEPLFEETLVEDGGGDRVLDSQADVSDLSRRSDQRLI